MSPDRSDVHFYMRITNTLALYACYFNTLVQLIFIFCVFLFWPLNRPQLLLSWETLCYVVYTRSLRQQITTSSIPLTTTFAGCYSQKKQITAVTQRLLCFQDCNFIRQGIAQMEAHWQKLPAAVGDY